MKTLQAMSKLILLFLFILILSGCQTIDNPKRLDGIINAVYTNYETNKDFNSINSYLKSKVENKEISELTSSVIKSCLERSYK